MTTIRFLRDGCYLYLYVNGKRVLSMARRWGDIKKYLDGAEQAQGSEEMPRAEARLLYQKS